MIVAAVQARMGSTRLPGKAMAEILGRPLLWHIVRRLQAARSVDGVVIATSDTAADDHIRAFARAEGIACFAGSESDLIDRLWRTAVSAGADALVRITADCPLVDPGWVDAVVERFQSDAMGLDYVCNILERTLPDGLDTELYTTRLLERLWREIEAPYWREAFPEYLWKHVARYRCASLVYPIDLSHLRWTVDYPEDLDFVRAAYEALYRDDAVFGMHEVLALLAARPELLELNVRHVADLPAAQAGLRRYQESTLRKVGA